MPDRTRPIRREICLNEQELSVVRHKMNQLGTNNFGAYARKMLIDGYIIKVDYTEQKKLAAAVSRIATNINHVCRRINSTGHFYDADVPGWKRLIPAKLPNTLSGCPGIWLPMTGTMPIITPPSRSGWTRTARAGARKTTPTTITRESVYESDFYENG